MNEIRKEEKGARWKLHYWFDSIERTTVDNFGRLPTMCFNDSVQVMAPGQIDVDYDCSEDGGVTLEISVRDSKFACIHRDEQNRSAIDEFREDAFGDDEFLGTAKCNPREKWTLYHVPGITLKDADDIIDWYKRYLASIGKLDEELAEIRRLWKEFPVD